MHHDVSAERPTLHGRLTRGRAPVLVVDSGDTVTVRGVPDVGWGLEPPTSTTAPRRKVEPRDPVADRGPCMFGPIEVRGARPGDALRIEIEHVRPGAWGWTYSGGGMSTPALNAALGLADAPLSLMTWKMDDARSVATNSHGHTVPVRAFPGTIGLLPAAEDACPWTPRACGGNMDCPLLTAGATLWLPVEVAGGMISLGDGHAAQGDGELSGTAIECMLEEVRLRVHVHAGAGLAGPRVKTIEGWATLGFAETLDRAAEVAAAEMLTLMQEEFGLSRAECLALASSRVSLRVSQMVNPRRGVHAVLTA